MAARSLTGVLRETLTIFDESQTPWTTSEVASHLDLGRRSTYERLQRLVEHGELDTKKVGANGRVWWKPAVTETQKEPRSSKNRAIADDVPLYDALDAAEVGVVVISESFEIEWVGNTVERYFGISREGIIGNDNRQFIRNHLSPRIEDGESFADTVLDTYEAETQIESIECITECDEHEARWLEHRSASIESGAYAGGRVELYYDISERKRREQELKHANERLQILFDETPDAITILSADADIIEVNEQCVENLGYTREELTSMNLTDIDVGLEPEMLPGFRTAMDEQPLRTEREHERKDGSAFPVEVSVSKIDLPGEPQYIGLSREITERKEWEQRLERQREQLAAVNHLNAMFYEVTDAVIKQSTRKETEQTVCEALVNADSYVSAWVGDVDSGSQTVNVHTGAGGEQPIDTTSIPISSDTDRTELIGEAVRSRRIRVTNEIGTGSPHEPRDDRVETRDRGSKAAVPLVHDGMVYGVLCVSTDRRPAFDEHEQAVLSQLGEIVSQAIAAAERKQALLSDEFVEIEFRVPEILEEIGVETSGDGNIALKEIVATSDGGYLVYGSLTPDARETLDAMLDQHPHWESATILSEVDDQIRFQVRVTELPLQSEIASIGGSIETVRYENGGLHLQLQLPTSVDVSSITDIVYETYPTARFLTKRQRPRSRHAEAPVQQSLFEELTERQLAALKAAYHRGYFEWPRNASGTELAESLGIAPATYSQHLRKAERKVFEAVFSPAQSVERATKRCRSLRDRLYWYTQPPKTLTTEKQRAATAARAVRRYLRYLR